MEIASSPFVFRGAVIFMPQKMGNLQALAEPRIPNDARSFVELRDYLGSHNIEGIVFWLNGEPKCKIKRSDFGFKWPSD